MKKSISFKTFGLLSVVGLAGFGVISCKKETSNNTPALTPVSFGFKNVQLKLGGSSTSNNGNTNGRYDGSGKLKADLSKDSTVAAFSDKTKSNYDLVVPTSLFSSLTGGNGDCMLLTLDVPESGTTIKVSKKETKSDGTDTTAFSFGVGKKGSGEIDGLPKQLVKDNGIVENVFQGDAIVIQLNVDYKVLEVLLGNKANKVVLTVTASKPGKASVTKTLTVTGDGSKSGSTTSS